jgi:CHAD domain-containing protein
MAFRIKHRKAVGRQLSRVVSKELASAVDSVAEPAAMSVDDVHEVRKRVKKVRAVLRLMAASLGTRYGTLNGRLRSASRRLSALRDADASLETLEQLRHRYPKVLAASRVGSIDRALKANRQRVQSGVPRLLAGVARALEDAARTVPRRIRKAADRNTMRSGMRRGYRRARKAMPKRGRDDDEDLHRWRRRVKDHWYHMRLLEGLNGRISGRVRSLKQLETWLGDHHNLVVLHRLILEAPSRFGDARTIATVIGCIEERRLALRRDACERGTRLFDAGSGRFGRQIDGWWKR